MLLEEWKIYNGELRRAIKYNQKHSVRTRNFKHTLQRFSFKQKAEQQPCCACC